MYFLDELPLKYFKLTGFSCIAWDPENRLETELEPIEQNCPLIINHHASGQVCLRSLTSGENNEPVINELLGTLCGIDKNKMESIWT